MVDKKDYLEILKSITRDDFEKAFENLTEAFNNSKYKNKLYKIINNEDWILDIKEEVKERRQAFRGRPLEISSL